MASSRNESNSNEVKQLLLWEKIPRSQNKTKILPEKPRKTKVTSFVYMGRDPDTYFVYQGKKHLQSIDQSIDQPIDQSIEKTRKHRSINRSLTRKHRSINRSLKSINQSINQSKFLDKHGKPEKDRMSFLIFDQHGWHRPMSVIVSISRIMRHQHSCSVIHKLSA